MAANVLTIAASAPFAETLARGLIERLGSNAMALADATIYLPTRRAARTFGDAFARVLGGAALLPQFKALGDVDEDEFLFDADAETFELQPSITSTRRTLLLAAMVRRWHATVRRGDELRAGRSALAKSLAVVMNEVETQGASLAKLDDGITRALAGHWEQSREFLSTSRHAIGPTS